MSYLKYWFFDAWHFAGMLTIHLIFLTALIVGLGFLASFWEDYLNFRKYKVSKARKEAFQQFFSDN